MNELTLLGLPQAQIEDLTRKLRDCDERYRLLVENVKDYAILMLDPEGRVVTWTAAAERIKGYTAQEIVGESFERFYLEDDVASGHPKEVLRAARTAGHFEENGWRARKGGSKFWASVMITAVYGERGELRGFSKMTRDISQQRIAEETAREREQFRVLLDCAPDAILIVDDRGDLVLVNERAEYLFGYSRAELLGTPIQNLFPASPRSNPGEGRNCSPQASSARQPGIGSERMGRRKDGELFCIEVNLRSVTTAKGVWMAAGIRDITEFKLAEERLITERKRAEEASRAKSEFLAAVSHEIRTPMNVIVGMSDLLSESELNLEQKEYVSVFRRAGGNLLTLIDDLLDLAKIEAGHFELEQVEFDLEEVVDQAVELIGAKARSKKLSLRSRIAPATPLSLVGDPARLRQVLINLLGNAVKFTESGHVLITVEKAPSGQAGEIKISVFDTGIGIAPDKVGMIFADFTQADSSITRRYGGAGLGLSISRRLVQRMGGELEVSSTQGKGSAFSFTARFAIGVNRPRQPQQVELQDIDGGSVMVIDDNADNCLILREALSAWGLAPKVFQGPEAALANLSHTLSKGQAYSLIIVDKSLPGTDGFALGERIRALAPSTPMVMLSCDAAIGDVTRSDKAGFAGYAVKPVKRADLFRLVCKAMLASGSPSGEPVVKATEPKKEETIEAPMAILIAEDSADNRLLIQAYMKGSRHNILFAEDGAAAVAEFTRGRFDLVIMDLQMPEMDGLTATLKIRALELERRLPPVPIVALSANAGAEDVELSRKAGCDDHLSKPISKSRLMTTIEGYARKAPRGQTSFPPPPDAVGRFAQSMPGLEAITVEYVAARRAEAPRLLELFDEGEFDTIRIAGHNMKGTGASYGYPVLTTMGAAIESAARGGDAESLSTGLHNLARYLDEASAASQPAEFESAHALK